MRKNKQIYKHYQTKEKTIKKKKTIFIIAIILVIGFISTMYIKNNMSKKYKIGNNSTSQEIIDYILNTNAYEAVIDVEIKSNKNSNKYKIKQTYKGNESNSQEVIEPSNIKGVKITRDGSNLKIENTELALNKIVEGYHDIAQNNLDLSSFIENYKKSNDSKWKEENNQIIMQTTTLTNNNYQKYETLYISKKDGQPIKMEIKDTNQNIIIYIIYNEMNLTHSNIGSEEYDNKKRRYVLC